MATTATNESEPVDEKVEQAAPKKGSMGKMMTIGIVIILILGGGFFAWKGGLLKKIMGTEEETALAAKNAPAQTDFGPMLPLETFIVNLADPQGKRYLKIKVELELEDAKVSDEINKRLPQMRDIVISMLSSKTAKEVSTLEGKYELRAQMRSTMNKSLQTGKIKKIYFTDFIVQ